MNVNPALSLKEQYGPRFETWQEQQSPPVVRFWCDDGTCWAISFFQIASMHYHPEEQTLLIECSSGTIVILDRLCQRRCQACAFERRIRGLVCVRIQKLGNFEFATSQHGPAIAEQQHAKVVVEHFVKRLFELRGIVEFLLGNQAQSAWRVANDRIAEKQNAS